MARIFKSIIFLSFFTYMVALICIHIILMILLKINLNQALKNLATISIFIIFTVVINIFAMSFKEAIIIGIRLAIICNATYIFTKILTPYQIAEVIKDLLTPLKLVKVNPENIAIMISIAIAFIPILSRELHNIIYSLKSKGLNTSIINLLKNMNLIMTPLFVSMLRKVNEVEYALKAKGYQAE